MANNKRTAIVLFNLGGPDGESAVQPFLFNLFSDKAIISLPNPLRYLIARLISAKRTPVATEIYNQIGGKSPILEETKRQALLLQGELNEAGNGEYKVFISMRYWKPFADEVIMKVKEYNPGEIILLPLYPQFSTTTTGSSMRQWKELAKKHRLDITTKTICCYPMEENFIASHARLIEKQYKEKYRILFSAHGLPEKVIKKGDPYQWQVEQTAAAIVKKLEIPALDWLVCYQSRVGPMKWIGPSTEEEIVRAGKENVPLIIVPVAFVSEHSETLVELDIEYKKLAQEKGVTDYIRIPTLSVEPGFIKALGEICLNSGIEGKTCSSDGGRICPGKFSKCIMGATTNG